MPSHGTTCCTSGPLRSRTSGASVPRSSTESSVPVLLIISVSTHLLDSHCPKTVVCNVDWSYFFLLFCCVAGIRQLQLMLLKMALLLGIEIHVNVEFKGLVEPPEDQETESK